MDLATGAASLVGSLPEQVQGLAVTPSGPADLAGLRAFLKQGLARARSYAAIEASSPPSTSRDRGILGVGLVRIERGRTEESPGQGPEPNKCIPHPPRPSNGSVRFLACSLVEFDAGAAKAIGNGRDAANCAARESIMLGFNFVMGVYPRPATDDEST